MKWRTTEEDTWHRLWLLYTRAHMYIHTCTNVSPHTCEHTYLHTCILHTDKQQQKRPTTLPSVFHQTPPFWRSRQELCVVPALRLRATSICAIQISIAANWSGWNTDEKKWVGRNWPGRTNLNLRGNCNIVHSDTMKAIGEAATTHSVRTVLGSQSNQKESWETTRSSFNVGAVQVWVFTTVNVFQLHREIAFAFHIGIFRGGKSGILSVP